MKSKSVMATFAAILVALSAVGFAYSAWTDQVQIEGVARMGEFIVCILYSPLPSGWYAPFVVEETTNGYPEDGTGAPTTGPGSFVPKPWVANTTVTLEDYRTSVHHEPTQTVAHKMNIYVDNAYPQYDAHIKFLLKNAGTIPANLRCVFVNATVESATEPPRLLVLVETGWTYNGTCWLNTGSLYDPILAADVINWHLTLCVPPSADPEP